VGIGVTLLLELPVALLLELLLELKRVPLLELLLLTAQVGTTSHVNGICISPVHVKGS
jgi:hypothetical protein